MHGCTYRKGREGICNNPLQDPPSHHREPIGHRRGLRDGTNTDPKANRAPSLPGQESFNSSAGLTCSTRTTLGEGWWHLPALLPTPVIASAACLVATQHGKPVSVVVTQQQDGPWPGSGRGDGRSCQLEQSQRRLALETTRHELRWQPNFANVSST